MKNYIARYWGRLQLGKRFAIILIVVLAILGTALGALLSHRSVTAHHQQSVETLSVAAKMLAVHIDEYMGHLMNDLERLGRLIPLVREDKNTGLLQEFMSSRPELLSIRYLSDSTDVTLGQWFGEGGLQVSAEPRLIMPAAIIDGVPLIQLQLRIDERLVLAQVNLWELSIQQGLLNIQLGEDGHPYLLDNKGTIITHPHQELIGQTLIDLAHIKNGNDSSLDQISSASFSLLDYTLGQVERKAGLVPLPHLGLIVGFSIPTQEILQPSIQLRRTLLMSAAFLTFIIILVALSLGRMVTNPLQLFLSQMRQLHDGEIDYLSYQGEFLEQKLTFSAVNKLIKKQRDMSVATINTLALILEAKDNRTNSHSQRVSRIAHLIARKMGYEGKPLEVLVRAAKLHDIGKIAIPDLVLLKETALSKNERKIIETHPEVAARVLAPLNFLKEEIMIIKQHHEHIDGSGYPKGLTGDKIHPLAKILAVADAYEAMTANRQYRKALSHTEAMERLLKGAGTQFDPDVVKAFKTLMAERFAQLGSMFTVFEEGSEPEITLEIEMLG